MGDKVERNTSRTKKRVLLNNKMRTVAVSGAKYAQTSDHKRVNIANMATSTDVKSKGKSKSKSSNNTH